MKLFNRIRTIAGSALAAAALLVGISMAAPASAQTVIISGGVQAYSDLPGCPVAPYDMQNVLSGMYGVDGLQRPLNRFGFPVDVYGNCLTPAPVGEVFNYQPAPLYVDFLWMHFHYHYFYNPGFVHVWGGPGVIVHGGYGAIPYGHTRVIVQQNYHYSAPVTVRPVGRTPGVYVAPGSTITARPGLGAPPAVARPGLPPAAVTPPRAVGGPSVFNRPAAPSAVTPPRATGGSSVFNRRH